MRLGDFLRRSLTLGSRETIPLAEELDLAEQLLSIEKVRFGDRLRHELRADDAARACAVPPLVLQPLVENAVTHGDRADAGGRDGPHRRPSGAGTSC